MSERFTPPTVTIRRLLGSRTYEVVVVVRRREMILRCQTYAEAVEWARLECKSYNILEVKVETPDDENFEEVPTFLRPPEQSS
jgi:hypothetical protein